jgi:hypothetical protein
MDAQTRERLKAKILEKAIQNGEVQPPFSPLPTRPTTQFEQSNFINDLLADESGQLPLAYATDAMPTYKAGGKSVDSLVEEMRLRFEYQVLDEQARIARDQAYMAAHGWDKMSWEERKAMGLLGRGFYSLDPYADRFRDATPAFNPELKTPGVEREPALYSLKFEGGEPVVVNKAAQPKPTPEQKKAKRAAASEERKRANKATTVLDKEAADLLKKREEILRQQQGAKC